MNGAPQPRKRIKYSLKFLKQLRHLPKRIIKQAGEKEALFRENPFHPSLDTHKLHGQDKDMWSFWVNRSYRIKFVFLADGEALFLEIGTHRIYK